MDFMGGDDAVCEIKVGGILLRVAVTDLSIDYSMKTFTTPEGFEMNIGDRAPTVTLKGVIFEQQISAAEIETVKQSLLEASRRKFRQV